MIKNGGDGRLMFKIDVWDGLTLAAAKKILRQARKERELLVISGEEPTGWAPLPKLLIFARQELKFEHIQLETSARVLSYPPYIDALVRLLANTRPPVGAEFTGLPSDFSFRVNVYSHRADVHDALTGVTGSWEQAMTGLAYLMERRQEVTTNTVITSRNYKELAAISDDLAKRGIMAQEFSLIHGGKPGYKELAVPYDRLAASLKELLSRRDKRTVFIENVPYCYLQGLENVMSDNYYPPGKERRLRYHTKSGAVKKEEYPRVACPHRARCRYEFICRGIDPQYVKKFGWKSIKPAAYVEESAALGKKAVRAFKKYRADSFVFFSGGVDSKCSSALFATANPDKNIVLVTLDNQCLYPDHRIIAKTSVDVLKKFSHIKGHVFLQSPRDLLRNEFMGKIDHWEKVKGMNTGCHLCVLTAISAAVSLVRQFDDKPKDFIYGFRQGSNYPKIFIHYVRLFLRQYDINLHTPVFEFRDKAAVHARLKEFGLSTASNQPLCLFTDKRYTLDKGDVNNAKGFDLFKDAQWEEKMKTARVSDEPFFESFAQLLQKRFGIVKIRAC
ncbi:MAG: hypothetical protein WCO69_01290 [Candidatus Omnitrophota bacterium]